jgi:flagellin
MISLQTNVTSLMAQQNLNTDNTFQSNTIEQLTSGYRINSSGDDAAGLAIANGYRSSVAELTQGVQNANDGTSQLQIIDGGLSNISTILDRMKTLATESASGTFTGSRATLNQEYSGLVTEINRQAANIGLNAGGQFNQNLNVYIGGASQAANASVNIDLSGTNNAVDATSLGLSNTNVLNGGVSLSGGTANTQALNDPNALFLAGDSQTFTFNVFSNGSAQTVTATVADTGTTGISESAVLSQLNTQLNQYGISAGTDGNGILQFSGSAAFTAEAVGAVAGANAGTDLGVATAGATGENTSNYIVDGAAAYTAPAATGSETLNFETSSGAKSVTLYGAANGTTPAASTVGVALTQINAALAGTGVAAVLNSAGTGISFQGANSFSVNDTQSLGAVGVFAAAANTNKTATAPTTGSSATSNGTAAITAINTAIANLGLVQGSIGAGENKLQYATNLAQSQITSYSAAESQIRDADVAAQAANLTKAQVLVQTSVAALAQANSAPQSILKLLQ